MSGNSWIVKKPRPGAPSGSGSSAFQVTIVEEPMPWEKNQTDTDSLTSSEADIGESCTNSVPGSCGEDSQESSGHRNNSPGQFDTPRPSVLMAPSTVPPLACPPRCHLEYASTNDATQLGIAAAVNNSSCRRDASGHTSEEGTEDFSLGEKSTTETTPYLTPRLGWKEDVDRPPTPDRNGFEVPIAREPFVGERDLGPFSSQSKAPTQNPLALNLPLKGQQGTLHGKVAQVDSPKQSADSDEVAQLSARLGSPLPEDFYQSTHTASSNEPRRYSNLIFERAQDFLMGWMVQHPPGTSDSVKMESPFSMSSNEGGSSSGQLESEVIVSDVVQHRGSVTRQDSPMVLPRLTPLLPQGQRHAVPEITEGRKDSKTDIELESAEEQEGVGKALLIPRSAGARERIKHCERWEDDDDSFLELSINTKSDSGTTETLSSFKLPVGESENDQVSASRTSPSRDLPPVIPGRKSSKSVMSGRPPRPHQSQDVKSKRADVNRLANMLQHQDSEDLFRDTAKVREYVRALQSIARTGSITPVRRALGVDEPESEISEICEMVDALEAGDNPDISRTSSEENPTRKLTMFWDAEEGLPDGAVFWQEETADEVRRIATSMIEGTEDYYSMDIDEAKGSHHGKGETHKFDDEVRQMTSGQFAAVAEQLREVIKVKSSKLDVDELGEFSGRSGLGGASCHPSKLKMESNGQTPGTDTRKVLQEPSQSDKRTPSTRKGFQKLTSFFRRRTSRSQDSGSSASSHAETPRHVEQLPLALNTVEEAPSDASYQIALPPLLEPHGSGSAIQTPHPLEDVMSTRNGGENASMQSLGGFVTGRSEVYTERSGALLPAAYASSKSVDSGKSESSLEERFYMLKVNFLLKQKDNSASPPNGHPPPRNAASACGEASGSTEVRSTHVLRASSQSCPEITDVEAINQLTSQKPQGYKPTNDINSILQQSKVDVFRLRGPLTDSQLKCALSINGKWKADWELSDSYDSLCQVMELGWVFKKGLENSDTLIFDSNAKECKSIARVAGLVNLTEKRPWDQSVVVHRRRDLRRGPSRCWVERYDGGIILRMDWDGPVSGTCYEFIELTEDCQTMVLRQELFRKNDGPSSVVRMVFRRVD